MFGNLRFVIILLASAAFSGCALNSMMKMAKDQKLEVAPKPLEVHSDTVKFEMSATLPVKMLKKDHTYAIDPVYEFANKEVRMARVEFVANEFPNSDSQQPRVVKEFQFPYEEIMNPGKLTIVGYGINNKNDKQKGPTPKLEVAKGLITTSKLVVPTYYGAYVSYDYEDETVDGWTPEEELEPTNVNFYFLQGSSVLRPSEKRSDRGEYFKAFVAEKNVTRTVTITGTHSPEGPERINSNLSENRAKVIEDYYRMMMKRYDYKGMADSIRFVLKPVVEDWSDFKKALEQYDGIDQAAKNEILTIINGPGTFEEKEDALHKLSSYRKIFRDIYPDLRTAQTEILTVIPKRTDAEISVLARQIAAGNLPADTLSYGELAYAAHLTPSLKEKAAIYEATVKTYSNWASHNNLAAVYINMIKDGIGNANSHAEKAVTHLEISLNKKKNAYAMGNMGSAELAMGNAQKAYAAVSDATGMDLPSKTLYGFNGTKGAMEIMMAKYPEAVKSLSSAMDDNDNLFNKGLAQVLAKEYENALVTFNELFEKDKDYAMAAYGAAIADARLGKKDPAIGSIIDAVEADPSLKGKISTDLEFNALMDDSRFIDAVK
jgi:tetratricopeptide (TPR) repeat protein